MIKGSCRYYVKCNDMGATVHFCKLHNIIDDCDYCKDFISKDADLIPVVRCKDCKRSYGGVWKDDKHLFCKMTNHLMWVDDFCSWGERREE